MYLDIFNVKDGGGTTRHVRNRHEHMSSLILEQCDVTMLERSDIAKGDLIFGKRLRPCKMIWVL